MLQQSGWEYYTSEIRAPHFIAFVLFGVGAWGFKKITASFVNGTLRLGSWLEMRRNALYNEAQKREGRLILRDRVESGEHLSLLMLIIGIVPAFSVGISPADGPLTIAFTVLIALVPLVTALYLHVTSTFLRLILLRAEVADEVRTKIAVVRMRVNELESHKEELDESHLKELVQMRDDMIFMERALTNYNYPKLRV